MAKLWGVYDNIQLVIRLRFKTIEINIDSHLVVKAINSKHNCSSIGNSLITKIKSMISHDKEFLVKHVHREVNSCANVLAKNDIERKSIVYLMCVLLLLITSLKVTCWMFLFLD